MKKTFLIEDLECAHCAAKMEEAVKRLDGVVGASVNFIKSNITIEADESVFDKVLKEAVKECKKIEPDAQIVI